MFKIDKELLVGVGMYILVMGIYQAAQSNSIITYLLPAIIEKAITGILVIVFIIGTPIVLKKLKVKYQKYVMVMSQDLSFSYLDWLGLKI